MSLYFYDINYNIHCKVAISEHAATTDVTIFMPVIGTVKHTRYDSCVESTLNFIKNYLEVQIKRLIQEERTSTLTLQINTLKSYIHDVENYAKLLGIILNRLNLDRCCNCCNKEIKENAIEDKWGVGYICINCQEEES